MEVENLRAHDPGCQQKLHPHTRGSLCHVGHDKRDYASVYPHLLAPGAPFLGPRYLPRIRRPKLSRGLSSAGI